MFFLLAWEPARVTQSGISQKVSGPICHFLASVSTAVNVVGIFQLVPFFEFPNFRINIAAPAPRTAHFAPGCFLPPPDNSRPSRCCSRPLVPIASLVLTPKDAFYKSINSLLITSAFPLPPSFPVELRNPLLLARFAATGEPFRFGGPHPFLA